MSPGQKRLAVVRALRNVRKQHRALQTRAEALERVLDRLIDRKTIITPGQLAQIQVPYNALHDRFSSVEAAIADALVVSSV